MQPAIARQNGRGFWLYKHPLRRCISDFFEGSDWDVDLIARPGTQYSFPYLRESRLRQWPSAFPFDISLILRRRHGMGTRMISIAPFSRRFITSARRTWGLVLAAHCGGEPTTKARWSSSELECITSSYYSHYPLWHTGDGLPGLGPRGKRLKQL